jgi:hypothetical protein
MVEQQHRDPLPFREPPPATERFIGQIKVLYGRPAPGGRSLAFQHPTRVEKGQLSRTATGDKMVHKSRAANEPRRFEHGRIGLDGAEGGR